MAAVITPNPQPTRERNSSHSRTRNISRPTTPLRPPSRTSLRASQTTPSGSTSTANSDFPLASLEPAIGELSDACADLEANFLHLQLIHESLGRFNENFGAFLYGMNMSAFCVDFPEAPIPQSFQRHKDTTSQGQYQDSPYHSRNQPAPDVEATFLTTDTSFVENPPTSSKPASKYSAPPSAGSSRQSLAPNRGSTGSRGRAGSGIGRGGSTRGGVSGSGSGTGRAGSGVARGVGRGRGVGR